MRFVIALLQFFLLVAPVSATADTALHDAQSPEFLEATQLWLDGDDDLSALRQLSALATDRNTAAQILLARIAGHSHLVQAVTEDLSRLDRIALLRQPGGLSGRSWLEAAAETSDYARALRDSAVFESRASAIGPLFELGEIAVATRAFAVLFYNGQGDQALQIVEHGADLSPEAWFFFAEMMRSDQFGAAAYSGSARVSRMSDVSPGALALTWAPVTPRALIEDRDQLAFAVENSLFVPAFQPLTAFCRTHCPDEAARCAAVGAAELGSADIMPFASPSQVLIPNEVYWRSERMQRDVVSRLNQSFRAPNWDYYSTISQCFVETMGNYAD